MPDPLKWMIHLLITCYLTLIPYQKGKSLEGKSQGLEHEWGLTSVHDIKQEISWEATKGFRILYF